MKRYIIPILLVVLGILACFCLYHFISSRVTLDEATTYQIFADLIVFILAFTTILVSIVGVFGYQWLHRRFEETIEHETKTARDELQRVRDQIVAEAKEFNSETRVTFHVAVCALYGRLYEFGLPSTEHLETGSNQSSTPEFDFLLELAVGHAKQAHSAAMELDKEKHKGLICRAENNLALALALRCHPEDAKEANDLARYLYTEADNFPANLEASWKETCAYVLWRFPLKKEDKSKATALFLELLERQDIDEGDKNSWLKRWSRSGFVLPGPTASSLD